MNDLDDICACLDGATHLAAATLGSGPEETRGQGHVKDKNQAEAMTLREQRRLAFYDPQSERRSAPFVAA